jgi:nitrous oxidase accessory protein NosD
MRQWDVDKQKLKPSPKGWLAVLIVFSLAVAVSGYGKVDILKDLNGNEVIDLTNKTAKLSEVKDSSGNIVIDVDNKQYNVSVLVNETGDKVLNLSNGDFPLSTATIIVSKSEKPWWCLWCSDQTCWRWANGTVGQCGSEPSDIIEWACNNASGGYVDVLYDTYTLSSDINIASDNVTIDLHNSLLEDGTIVINAQNVVVKNVFLYTDNSLTHHIQVEGDYATVENAVGYGTNATSVVRINASHVKVVNTELRDSTGSYAVYSKPSTPLTDLKIINTKCDSGSICVDLDGANAPITDFTVEGTVADGINQFAVAVANGRDFGIYNTEAKNVAGGTNSEGIHIEQSSNFTVHGFNLKDIETEAIAISSSHEFSVTSGSIFQDSSKTVSHGIFLFTDTSEGVITGVTIDMDGSTTKDGILLWDNVDNITIIGNTIKGARYGVAVTSNSSALVGLNTIVDCVSGIADSATTENIEVYYNYFMNNTNDYSFSSSNYVRLDKEHFTLPTTAGTQTGDIWWDNALYVNTPSGNATFGVGACTIKIAKEGSETVARWCENGTVLASGTNAETVLQNVVDSLSNGGKVVLLCEDYGITHLNITNDNITLIGGGACTKLTITSGYNGSIIYINASDVTLKNFMIDASNQNPYAANYGIQAIEGVDNQRLTVEGLILQDVYDIGIFVQGVDNSTIRNNWISTRSGGGIILDSATSFTEISNNKVFSEDAGIGLGENTHDNSVHDNFIDKTGTTKGYGIDLFGACNNNIHDNTIINPPYDGIFVHSTDGVYSPKNNIHNNRIYLNFGSRHGINVQEFAHYSNIHHNLIYGLQGATNRGIRLDAVNFSTVNYNIIETDTSGTAPNSFIDLQNSAGACWNNTVAYNILTDHLGATVGINVGAGNYYNKIILNSFNNITNRLNVVSKPNTVWDEEHFTVPISAPSYSQTGNIWISGGEIQYYNGTSTETLVNLTYFNENVAGGVSTLSGLTIDTDKDWQNYGIYNLSYCSANDNFTAPTGIFDYLNDTSGNPFVYWYAGVNITDLALNSLQDTADVVKDSHIDWGSGAGQVDLSDVPPADYDMGDYSLNVSRVTGNTNRTFDAFNSTGEWAVVLKVNQSIVWLNDTGQLSAYIKDNGTALILEKV